MNAQPEFQMDDVDMEEVEDLINGDEIINMLTESTRTGQFEGFTCSLYDHENVDVYEYDCFGYTLLNRYGINRIYLSLRDKGAAPGAVWYTYYMARRDDGQYVIVQEKDEDMREEFRTTMLKISGEDSTEDVPKSNPKKKSGGKTALKVILIIICFPFWLLWQFIKALLSLLNIGFGDSSFVKSFKKGYNGDSDDYKEYTFTNDMGCQQTVYSRDGRTFYYSDGSYAGSSNDGGKTIR